MGWWDGMDGDLFVKRGDLDVVKIRRRMKRQQGKRHSDQILCYTTCYYYFLFKIGLPLSQQDLNPGGTWAPVKAYLHAGNPEEDEQEKSISEWYINLISLTRFRPCSPPDSFEVLWFFKMKLSVAGNDFLILFIVVTITSFIVCCCVICWETGREAASEDEYPNFWRKPHQFPTWETLVGLGGMDCVCGLIPAESLKSLLNA